MVYKDDLIEVEHKLRDVLAAVARARRYCKKENITPAACVASAAVLRTSWKLAEKVGMLPDPYSPDEDDYRTPPSSPV